MFPRKLMVKPKQTNDYRSHTPSFRRGNSDISSRFRTVTSVKKIELRRAKTTFVPKQNYCKLRLLLVPPKQDNPFLQKVLLFEKTMPLELKPKKPKKNLIIDPLLLRAKKQQQQKNSAKLKHPQTNIGFTMQRVNQQSCTAKIQEVRTKEQFSNRNPVKNSKICWVIGERTSKKEPNLHGKVIQNRKNKSPIKKCQINNIKSFIVNRNQVAKGHFSGRPQMNILNKTFDGSTHVNSRNIQFCLSGSGNKYSEHSLTHTHNKVQRVMARGSSPKYDHPSFARNIQRKFYKKQMSGPVHTDTVTRNIKKYVRSESSTVVNGTFGSKWMPYTIDEKTINFRKLVSLKISKSKRNE